MISIDCGQVVCNGWAALVKNRGVVVKAVSQGRYRNEKLYIMSLQEETDQILGMQVVRYRFQAGRQGIKQQV